MFFRYFLLSILAGTHAFGGYQSKISDLVSIEGIKKNFLTGYGLVVGLNGTGDSRSALTRRSINQYLSHLGIIMEERNLDTENAAAVAVVAELRGFYEKGDLVDIQVASLGDSESLENGMLLQTVLKAPDGETYAVASGVVSISGSDNGSSSRGVVISGGIIEKNIKDFSTFNFSNGVVLNLKHPSIALAHTIKTAVETQFPDLQAHVIDYKKLEITSKTLTPLEIKQIADIFVLEVEVNPPAKIVIDRNTGLVVVANDVRIDSAFISLPGITVSVDGEQTANIADVIEKNTTIQDLARNFNKIGLDPDKIISIFSALKHSGALNAEIITQ